MSQNAIRYLSLFSGVEAATLAWKPLGWKPVAFAEFDAFPSAVLAHHYSEVPNLGDVTKIEGSRYREAVDLIVGGSPCQGFSVAGKQLGLNDERSGLALNQWRGRFPSLYRKNYRNRVWRFVANS